MADPLPPDTAPPDAGPLRAREVVRTAHRVYRGNFARVAVPAVVVFGTVALVEGAAERWASGPDEPYEVAALVGASVLVALGETFYAGLLDRLVGASAFGHEHESVGRILRSLPYGQLVGADLLLVFVSAVASLFLVLPGILTFTRLALVGPLINIEGHGIGAAFKRSWQISRGHFWVVMCLVTLPLEAEQQITAAVRGLVHGESVLVTFAVDGLVGAAVGAVVGLLVVSLVHELIARHPRP